MAEIVDARGLSCPIPVMRTKKVLEVYPDEAVVLVDAYVQVENVTRLAGSRGYEVRKVNKESGAYRLSMVRCSDA